MSVYTCYRCAESDHLHCLNRVSLERVCECDTCDQIRKDAEDDAVENLERDADSDRREDD